MLITMCKNFLHFFCKKFATIKTCIIFATMKQEIKIKELVTGHRFETCLTDQEWEQFEMNRQRFSLFPYPLPLSVYLQIPFTNFKDFISHAFFTMDTPEGLNYWFNIVERNK